MLILGRIGQRLLGLFSGEDQPLQGLIRHTGVHFLSFKFAYIETLEPIDCLAHHQFHLCIDNPAKLAVTWHVSLQFLCPAGNR